MRRGTTTESDDESALLAGELRAMQARLDQQQEQYDSIFDATGDGLAINDLDGTLVEANPAFCRMHGYTREELLRLRPDEFVHPSCHHLFRNFIATVAAGGTFACRAIDVRKDGTLLHVDVRGSLFTFQGRPHVLGVVRDITPQVEQEALREQEVADRTSELSTLLSVSHKVASTLHLTPLSQLILEELKPVTNYTGASIGMFEGSDLTLLDSRGPDGSEAVAIGMRLSLLPEGQPIWDRIQRREPVLCADVRGEGTIAAAYRSIMGDRLESAPFRYVRSWLALPLAVGDRVIGLLSLSQEMPGHYTERHAALALAIADQVAVALENARLYEDAQEENRKTAALAEIGASVALAGSLETILGRLAGSVIKPTGAIACAVLLLEGDPPRERIAGTHGLDEGWSVAYELAIRRGARSISYQAVLEGRPLVLRDARNVILGIPEWEPIFPFVREVAWDTYVSVPLVARDRTLGSLGICYAAGDKPTDADLTFLSAVADQAAIAVDNARLFAEVQGKAALEERQRLARELHDSVSQALYGIALGARTARSLLDRDPSRLAEPLDYVLSLAEAGLAEMRALIFELRPESLATEGLVAALGRQATLLRIRHGLSVQLEVGTEPEVSLECKEALYRIAQEAAQNIVKHARAAEVQIRLSESDGAICLEVRDDGAGFDSGGTFPGHLGLRSMEERATWLGGSFELQSTPGKGTILRAKLPCAPAETV
jgi:PAS domain S-box-containing protein